MLEVFSFIVGACGFIVAFTTLWNNSRKTTKEETGKDVREKVTLQAQIDIVNNTLMTRLNAIDDNIRDLKADNRSVKNDITKMRDELRDEIKEIRDMSQHALELSESAHRRLNRLGADPDDKIVHD